MKALVVGLGRMGCFHRKVLRDLGYDVTTADSAPGHADYAVPPKRGFAVTVIAAPIVHLAECAAERVPFSGLMLVEKPFASTSREACELADALEPESVAVGYVERFNPQVRALRRLAPTDAIFQRWNVRESVDVALDLTSHDVDLARWLGLAAASYDSRAAAPRVVRQVITPEGAVDLCAHDTSPLHAQWHAFLSGHPDYATVDDAIGVLEQLTASTTEVLA